MLNLSREDVAATRLAILAESRAARSVHDLPVDYANKKSLSHALSADDPARRTPDAERATKSAMARGEGNLPRCPHPSTPSSSTGSTTARQAGTRRRWIGEVKRSSRGPPVCTQPRLPRSSVRARPRRRRTGGQRRRAGRPPRRSASSATTRTAWGCSPSSRRRGVTTEGIAGAARLPDPHQGPHPRRRQALDQAADRALRHRGDARRSPPGSAAVSPASWSAGPARRGSPSSRITATARSSRRCSPGCATPWASGPR